MKALFIGRFQPFHKGHAELVRLASKEYDKLIIGIGSAQISHEIENPFTVKERRRMIKEFLKSEDIDNFQIYEIPDINILETSSDKLLVWRRYSSKENLQSDPNKATYEIIYSAGIDITEINETILTTNIKTTNDEWKFSYDILTSVISSEEKPSFFSSKDPLPEWIDHVISLVPKFDVVLSNNQLTKELFSKAGYIVKDIPLFNRGEFSGKEIRRRMIIDKDWENLVPQEVCKIIKEIGGVQRLKELSKR
jgi:nicotinamide-nucleotide adenylyltransferase